MEPITNGPFLQTLLRLALALAVGLFVGLERERRGKEAGLRTFAFVALLGALGGLLDQPYAWLSLALTGLIVVFLNVEAIRNGPGAELTTSAALLVTCYAGILSGQGQTFTPAVVGIITSALLAWKFPLVTFTTAMTEAELRAAILLAILSFVVYPVLPAGPIDPLRLIDPRVTWLTIILIAAIGFANYVLLKLLGTRGIEIGGFFGGLVNSSVTVSDLAARANQPDDRLVGVAYRGILLANAAMLVRNTFLLGLFDLAAIRAALLPLGLMFVANAGFLLLDYRQRPRVPLSQGVAPRLESPFSLPTALRFGLIFLALQVAGGLGERLLGQFGFYAVSTVGGLVSSASAVASAATLGANGSIGASAAGVGAAIASVTSALIHLPLVTRVSQNPELRWRLTRALVTVVAAGTLGVIASVTRLGT